MQQFEVNDLDDSNAKIAQGLFGYCTYDAVQFFETIKVIIIKEITQSSKFL